MKKELTKQDILDMIAKSSQKSEERSKKFNEDLAESSKKFNEDLARSRKEWEERSRKYDEYSAKSKQEREERDKEWDEEMKELTNKMESAYMNVFWDDLREIAGEMKIPNLTS